MLLAKNPHRGSELTKYEVESSGTNKVLEAAKIEDKLDIILNLVLYSKLTCCTDELSE